MKCHELTEILVNAGRFLPQGEKVKTMKWVTV